MGGKAGVNVKDNSDCWEVPGAREERRGEDTGFKAKKNLPSSPVLSLTV